MTEKNFIKKQAVSNVEFKAQIIEFLVGLAIAIVGLVLYFPSMASGEESLISLGIMLVGAYLGVSGISGIIPFGISMFFEKGKYIAFTEDELIIYSPNPKNCVNIPLKNIESIKRNKAFSIDFVSGIVGKTKGTGELIIEYKDSNGVDDSDSFGPIDGCDEFVKSLNKIIGK